ncbi:MAG: [FeFe] hydrogenase H-cluster radical SAM maturase HydE [Termitinemataceae bacterium]|nr:MAG: [FeFe] hydrogenase H-cluster radical SAM maturase HydE [Termitinemataceae bacterium]
MTYFNDSELLHHITSEDETEMQELFAMARQVRQRHYGKDVYFRGLIEFTNYCKNDCLYCGLRRSNKAVQRYRLSEKEILDCCRTGDMLGFKTFVLQGGEDPFYTDDMLESVIRNIRSKFPCHAITLSIGERTKESYKRLFNAGANRYLLRHETANNEHYKKMHPQSMSLENRKACLFELKEIGFQTGAGFMTGSPFQTPKCLLEDLRFLQELQPEMVGIGPFIPQADTPFSGYPQGSLNLTLRLIALTRLLLPASLIPATTALGTINPQGREMGLMAGANVVMPNLSPQEKRKLYALYDNKICTGDEASECIRCMRLRITSFNFIPNMGRGDFIGGIYE